MNVRRVAATAAILGFVLLHAERSTAAPEYRMAIINHHFDPPELEVPAGQRIKLLVDNRDPTPEEFESYDLDREKVIPAGTTGAIFIGPLEPGRYEVFGDFHPDTTRGHIISK